MKPQLEHIDLGDASSLIVREIRVPFFSAPWHYHPEYELTWIVRGKGNRFVGDHFEPFEDNDLVFLGANLPHYWVTSEPAQKRQDYSQAVVIQFRHDFLGGDIFHKPELAAIATFLKQSHRGLKLTGSPATPVHQKMRRMVSLDSMHRLLLLLEILCDLSQSASRPLARQHYQPSLNLQQNERLRSVFDYVMDHIDQDIEQARVARQLGMSPPSFSRFFKNVTGKTFAAFVNELRISNVRKQLIETDKAITTIAFECGYSNLSNFNRHFQKLNNMAPRQYRQAFLDRGAGRT